MNVALPSRRWLVRLAVLLAVGALLSPAAMAAVSDDHQESTPELKRGTIKSPAEGNTTVAIQGFHFKGQSAEKKPARLVAAGERGKTQWVYNGSKHGAAWFYDVDPMPNGHLLVTQPNPDVTRVFELDPDTGERVWEVKLDTHDTHDVDMLPNGDLVVADMRNWENGRAKDRLFVYDRDTGEITWEWQFRDYYPNSTDKGMHKDWTHVNDVDVIDEHRLLVSPRNFDQVIVLNRTSGEIEMRLGEDQNHDVLFEQHNPDWLVSENGTPTILVADSENDRVVEYAYENGEWVRTWEVGINGSLDWPRDADRLPNGNTLITDSLNHRVIEVTPTGEIVWEYYATWAPYDSERVAHGGGSNGPTIRDLGASGSYNVTGSAGLRPGTGDTLTFAGRVQATFAGTPIQGPMTAFAQRWSHVTPWVRPTWMSSWEFFYGVVAVLVVVGWAAGELVVNRRRLVTGVSRLNERVR